LNGKWLVALAVVFVSACKGEAGSCVITAQGEYSRDSCDVSLTGDECVGPNKTFHPQESREKAQTYCMLEGFKASPPDAEDPSMYYRR
jgi:hypothetical protein